MPMTPDAKKSLSATIRALRGQLLEDLHGATESAYRLSVRGQDTGLDEAARVRRKRLEDWIAEQVRAEAKGRSRSAEDFRREAEKQAAYTLLNRVVLLRLLEAVEPKRPTVVTGGWESRGYKDFRALAPALVRGDESEGYAFLLRLVFEDLATELPGLFGPSGVAELVPVPATTLRQLVEALDDSALATCWNDDMTLGWVYQYWNDPAREELDTKLNEGGKVERHEIASKTQMFTERYMVDWLLQNSLGPMWLATCRKNGWVADVEADGTLDVLEARRVEWRGKRDRGEVSLTELMPLHTDAERRWAYHVPQPIPADAVEKAPASVRDIKLIDPAVGSGHFLVVAFELLVALYREEARHRRVAGDPAWSDRAIVERILEHNLHGVDLDPRAVQIAAATLWLKARMVAPKARPARLNLVAAQFRLGALPEDDAALVELRAEVERETGIPGALTDTIVRGLRDADHLGSLLRVDAAVEKALADQEDALGRLQPTQMPMFGAPAPQQVRLSIGREEARATVLDRLEGFLAKHTGADDLGLRLRGEQLAAGVRFVRMVHDGTYDLVVGNPPYQGTKKLGDTRYLFEQYPSASADLYAAFLLRGQLLLRPGGWLAMVTIRSWLFTADFEELRGEFSVNSRMVCIADLSWGAFESMRDSPIAMTVWARGALTVDVVAIAPTNPLARNRTQEQRQLNVAGLIVHASRFDSPVGLAENVPGRPLIYWWQADDFDAFRGAKLLHEVANVAQGISSTDDPRYIRLAWETRPPHMVRVGALISTSFNVQTRVPLIKGPLFGPWIEPLAYSIHWAPAGLAIRLEEGVAFRNEAFHFVAGIAFTAMGDRFSARAHRYHSVCQNKGTSVYNRNLAEVLVALNRSRSAFLAASLNPGVGFEVGDVERIPFTPDSMAAAIASTIEEPFTLHESHREPSVEFRRPGPSPWRHAQEWAQLAVDRPEGAPLPPYDEELKPEPPTDHLSFALGVALGRFGADGEGILDPTTADLSHALPAGTLFLDGTLDPNDRRDGLGHPAAAVLHAAWQTHGAAIDVETDIRSWLRTGFFSLHRTMYENRPIHWPLSSKARTFVAWVNIHRFDGDTLRVLLADALHPTLARIDGELVDLRAARDGADKRAAKDAEKRFARVKKARDELADFIADVEQCAERGPPPTDAACKPRDKDARYAPDLDDGVMINSAALWPLLAPQWKDPAKWWKELANAAGKKDYDWSHLAMRYWPARVDKKCQDAPSLGVAHGCFWRYHPARAWAWELRLQDEIGPDFRIAEAPCRGEGGDVAYRAAFLQAAPAAALEAVEKEALRRRRKQKQPQSELRLLEVGLWSAVPELCWALELRLIDKQGADFVLVAPDEPAARASWLAANPGRARDRAAVLAAARQRSLFEEPEPDQTAGDEADAAEGEE